MAGEKWSAWVPAEAPASAPAPTPAELEVADPAPASDAVEQADPSEEPSEAVEDDEPEASAPAEERAAPRANRQSQSGRAQRGAAVRALFARASVARRAGLMSEAADIYAELLRRYPRDTRAAVSAFELGRIRMDALDDPRAAARAFAQALRLSRSGQAQFREDALARLTIADDALGDRAACRKVRERYLSEFPEGVHAASLARLCGAAQH
jgi:TolA-binding protein